VTTQPAFDPLRLLAALHDGGVKFIVVGGFAGNLLGSPSFTWDLDVCYARDQANLEALAKVLVSLNARLRGVTEDVPFRVDARSLKAGDSFTFLTDGGPFDILGTPTGTEGFEDLARNANPMSVDGRTILVACIDDLIRMKLAAARPKDLIEAEVLGALREEIAAYG
jgi:hypothetical protein